MEFDFFIGIDISKDTLDFTVTGLTGELLYERIENSMIALKAFCTKLKKTKGFLWGKALFCMEHTGIYNSFLLEYLYGKKAWIWVEHAQRIKESFSSSRGKSDKLDSARIAQYAFKHQEKIILWEPPRQQIKQLGQLVSTRSRLIRARKMLTQPMKESVQFKTAGDIKPDELIKHTLKGIVKDLERIMTDIEMIIKNDERLNELFNLIVSVPGVGEIVATNVLVSTNEFKRFTDANKYACHCGVAPFGESSGKYAKKPRVHHMADKRLKTIFHLAATAIIRTKGELRNYYDRMVNKGKHKMSVLNALRNKIIHRIFAVVKRKTPYIHYNEKKLQPAFV
jgi:transposase